MERGGRWKLQVVANGDTLRQERLSRDLHEALKNNAGFTLDLAPGDTAISSNAKSAGLTGDLALWATVATASATVLTTLIKEWCAKDRHRKVELTCEDASITITGRMDAVQEEALQQFLKRMAE